MMLRLLITEKALSEAEQIKDRGNSDLRFQKTYGLQ